MDHVESTNEAEAEAEAEAGRAVDVLRLYGHHAEANAVLALIQRLRDIDEADARGAAGRRPDPDGEVRAVEAP